MEELWIIRLVQIFSIKLLTVIAISAAITAVALAPIVTLALFWFAMVPLVPLLIGYLVAAGVGAIVTLTTLIIKSVVNAQINKRLKQDITLINKT